MLLAIDAGNTQTHIGVFSEGALAAQWRISTRPVRTADELAGCLGNLLALGSLSFSDLTGVVIGSVVPAATSSAVRMARRFCRVEPVVVGPGTRTGISIATDNPREVGADRVANAAAAYEQTGGPAIVVDFGTATTFDAVSRSGEYLGGAICPGVEVSAAALSSAAAQLLDVELAAPRDVIGRTTSESLRSGIVLGTAAMVDGMAEKLNKQLGGDAVVLATGGLAPLIIENCSTPITHEPNLTLNGLSLLYERNAAPH